MAAAASVVSPSIDEYVRFGALLQSTKMDLSKINDKAVRARHLDLLIRAAARPDDAAALRVCARVGMFAVTEGEGARLQSIEALIAQRIHGLALSPLSSAMHSLCYGVAFTPLDPTLVLTDDDAQALQAVIDRLTAVDGVTSPSAELEKLLEQPQSHRRDVAMLMFMASASRWGSATELFMHIRELLLLREMRAKCEATMTEGDAAALPDDITFQSASFADVVRQAVLVWRSTPDDTTLRNEKRKRDRAQLQRAAAEGRLDRFKEAVARPKKRAADDKDSDDDDNDNDKASNASSDGIGALMRALGVNRRQ